jgi:dienelactone hydrolase
VGLTYLRWKRRRGALAGALAVLAVAEGSVTPPAFSGSLTVSVPAPTGPNRVGTLSMRIVDSKRIDPYLGAGTKRELLVRFWYPILIGVPCRPAEYASPQVWAYFSELVSIPLPEIRTNSCWNAPIAKGVHAIIVLTHSYTGTLTDYTFIAEELASRGYVVASIAHTYETTAVEFPDGRLAKSMVGSYLAPESLSFDEVSLSLARSVRLEDLKFILDEFARLNSKIDSPFAGQLDLSRVGLVGHSLGGEAAIFSVEHDARFKAGVILDGVVTNASALGTDKAVLILAAGREQWSDNECMLWSHLQGFRFAANLLGADHMTPSDAVWLAAHTPELALQTGRMGPERTVAVIRNYIAAFFDANLRGQPMNSLLTGPSPDSPEVVVTTREGSLCGKP